MQFKHPELLYALFLLLIPIFIHLFQLRKFKKISFTNVAFLKNAILQTRKSQELKKYLILATRLLLLTCIIIAFAQPFTSKTSHFNEKKETVIYLDNSFSMQAKGSNGELFKRAIQDILNNLDENDNISILTNNIQYRNTSLKNIKNELLKLEYSSNKLNLDAALLKSKSFFSKQPNTLKNLIFVSDFQQDSKTFQPKSDSLIHLHFVKLEPVTRENIAIDSAYISDNTLNNITLKVCLKNTGNVIDNLPISLFNNDKLIAKTSVSIKDKTETTFSIPANDVVNGKIIIEDTHLQYDNTLYFNLNKTPKINVLSINNADDNFLKRIYTEDEFNYTSTPLNQLKYNLIDAQNLIIINELDQIPNALSIALNAFCKNGGVLLLIPSNTIDITSYNTLLNKNKIYFSELSNREKQVTTINYEHPLYKNNVFEKQVSNFQYPKVNSFYNIKASEMSSILKFEDGKAFLNQFENMFVFLSALNTTNSNFQQSPLIVPTLYNIGTFSLKSPPIYFTIGFENQFEIETKLQQDVVLTLVNNLTEIIPQQQYFSNKIKITTVETPEIASIYTIKNKTEQLQNVSYNYDRIESNLAYNTLTDASNITITNSIIDVFDTIKSDSKINAFWKWFVIFALIFLIIEMLILKFFK